MRKTVEEVLDRVDQLRAMGNQGERARIRAVMNGGAAGVQAVFNATMDDRPQHGHGSGHGADSSTMMDLPTANVMYSGLERMAQRVGRQPTLKTDTVPHADTDTARAKVEKRGRIVRGWDEMTRMELQYPQIGRWLPGYGFTIHVIRDRKLGGTTYPVAELRDPYDVFPGMWGVDQQPADVAIVRHMSRKLIRKSYPEFAAQFDTAWKKRSTRDIPVIGEYQTGRWEGNPHHPTVIVEYMCGHGTHVVCPEVGLELGFIPNPLDSGPAFVVTKRFSFDQLQSHFAHVFGIMAMMGKMNILGLMATEDGTFRETNIIGELKGSKYKKGRHKVNLFEPGTRIERPSIDQIQQTWQAINTLERQFRVVSGYPVAADGQSPNSFATGEGIRELGGSADDNVREYQLAVRHGVEQVDMKRLEWEDKLHAAESKKIYWYESSNRLEESYKPVKDIDGDYRTRRIYGAMATFDESTKIVTGLQLVSGRIFDRRTMQENLDGLEDIELINERMDQDDAKRGLLEALSARAAQQDPAAMMALVEITLRPSDTMKILQKLFTPEEPQATPEEMAMMQGGPGIGPGSPQLALGPGGGGGPPEPVQSVLSRMMGAGDTGGAQTVATQ